MSKWKELAQFVAAIMTVFALLVTGLWAFATRLEGDIWERIGRRGVAIKEEIREMIDKHEREHHGD